METSGLTTRLESGPTVIAICNYKGGVGKTTTTINLAGPLAQRGHRVLIVDLDPLANASMSVGVRLKTPSDEGVMEMLMFKDAPLAQCIWEANEHICDVIPAREELMSIEHSLMVDPRGRLRLIENVIERVAENYDYILIDCPPSIGIFAQLALAAATHVIIPINVGYFSLEGLAKMLDLVENIQTTVNADLTLWGVLLTKYDMRTKLSEETLATLSKGSFPVLEPVIRICVEVERAQLERLPLSHYDGKCTAAQDYNDLALSIDTSRWHDRLSATEKGMIDAQAQNWTS